ncbi:ABC transporter permease [Bacillus ndiopicus]|uniref:ABC transporter permease n=1 Tax=Bacillus ndiopicus TaxID=1347368 RepID=UPI0005A88710|nr:ABC transporter permease [Bacillus ndiopicus]
MFIAFIRKQLTLIWRSPGELQLLLGMPLIMIMIINFAFGAFMEEDAVSVQAQVALIEQDDEQLALQEFGEMQNAILPITYLKQELLQLQQFINVTTIEAQSLEEAKKSNDYSAIVVIPEGFTAQYLTSLFLQGEAPALEIYLNDKREFTPLIVQNIMDSYQRQFTLHSAFVQQGLITANSIIPTGEFSSTIETVNQRPPVMLSAYYSFGFSVMFVLYWVGIMAGQALSEKESHIFNRMVLANIPPVRYLLTILLSTIILVTLQMLILFTIVHIVFDVAFEGLLGYVVTTVCIATTVGGMAAFYSALNYRNNSYEASSLFNTVFVSILALLGGSFFNLSLAVPKLAKLGHFTPNGAALQSYLLLQQGASFAQLAPYLMTLLLLTLAFFFAAVRIFPKKGGLA